MKKFAINTLKYIFFLSIGIGIFWYLYREIDPEEFKTSLKDLKYGWLILSIVFGLLSQLSRAMRWKMLIKPLGYNPALSNTFLSVLVLYFVNLILPRAGEVARCLVVSRTDKVPFTKLIGTVFIERLADVIMLFFLAIIIFATNIPIVMEFFERHPIDVNKFSQLLSLKYILIAGLALLLLVVVFYLIWKRVQRMDIKAKLINLKNQFIDGIKSIAKMEKKWLFIGHTTFIFLMWLVMLYVVFLAYAPTAHLSLRTGMVVFLMGGLAMLVPIQGGIGPWHYMVIQTLLLYDISESEGLIFAFVAHTTTNLIYIVLGGIAILLLVLKYGNSALRLRATE